jgi:two-component system, cell cycle response regulator DivK
LTPPAPDASAPVVLVVDDNDDTRTMYAALLSTWGFRVQVAADGAQALAAADERPDVIVMDLAMPGLNGWEATRRLKSAERTKDIPVIVLTAHALDHYREVAVAAGCDAFLSKPCTIEELVAAIRTVLAR